MPRLGGALDVVQVNDPATPQAGRQYLYFKSDGALYVRRPDGSIGSVISTDTAQTITGDKTFSGTVTLNGSITGTGFASHTAQIRANSTLVGGGTLVTTTLPGIRWNARFLSISNGRGAHYGSGGYFDINSPAAGTVITGVGGAANQTVAADGTIPLPGWHALYYVLPLGQSTISLAANFRIASYTADLQVPADWVLVAVHNSEAATIRWGVGVTMKLGEAFDMRNGTGAGQFVDLISAQSITAVKTFTAKPIFANGWTVNSGQFVGFNAPAATATTTVQNSSTLVFATSYWDGTTSQGGESVVLSGQRASTTAGDLYLNSNRPIRSATYTGTSQVGFIVNTAAGLSRDIAYQSAGVNRWMMRVSGDAETGNATGSHWQIVSRNDDGSFRHTPLAIGRDTGYVDATIRLTEAGQRVFSLGNKVPINGLTATGTPDATTYLRGDGTWAVGATGPKGDTGATGAAATVAAGTTTTGVEGTSASVTNSGTSSAAVLDFTIPSGATGATGAKGSVGAANLLPADLATGSSIDWTTVTGATQAVSTAAAREGTSSILLTASGTAAMVLTSLETAAGRIPVEPNVEYTAVASTRSQRNATTAIIWYDAAGAVISTSTGSSGFALDTTFIQWSVTAIAPSDAASAAIRVTTATGSAGQTAYVDTLGLWEGSARTWVNPLPLTPARGSITVANVQTGWTVTSATMMRWGPLRSFRAILTRTGAAIGPSDASGNFTDSTIATAGGLDVGDRPQANHETRAWIPGVIFVGVRIGADGGLVLVHANGTDAYTLAQNAALTIEHTYSVV